MRVPFCAEGPFTCGDRSCSHAAASQSKSPAIILSHSSVLPCPAHCEFALIALSSNSRWGSYPALSAWRTWELRASQMPLARGWQVQEPASPSPGEAPPCSPRDHFTWGCTVTWLLPLSHPASHSALPVSPVSTYSTRHLYRVCCWGPRRSVSSAENELCLKKPSLYH